MGPATDELAHHVIARSSAFGELRLWHGDLLPADAKAECTRIENYYLKNDGYDGWDLPEAAAD